MLKRFASVIVATFFLIFHAISPAHAIDRRGEAFSEKMSANNVAICWTAGEGECRHFGPANAQGTIDQCPLDSIRTLMYRTYRDKGGALDKVTDVGGIGGLMTILERDQTGRIWVEFTDCGSEAGGKLQGLMCVDLEEKSESEWIEFEGCFYVTEL